MQATRVNAERPALSRPVAVLQVKWFTCAGPAITLPSPSSSVVFTLRGLSKISARICLSETKNACLMAGLIDF